MQFRRLVLASAAAFAAVPAARAADAVVVAEPEPMEYVRVCDTYGVGFYYIPGTETCLKISGYIRMDIGAEAFGLTDVVDKKAAAEDDPRYWEDLHNTYDTRTRFQLRMDARNETELGTLRAYAAISFDYETVVDDDYRFAGDRYSSTAPDYMSVEHAYVQLGGIRAGKTDSLFTTFTGFAGGVINDDIIGYGPKKTHQIAYGWEGDSGLALAVALEMGDGDLIAPFIPPIIGAPNLYTLDSYAPHVVGGIGWQGAWGGASIVAGYDSVWEQGAVKGRVDFYPTDRLALFAMAAWASYDDEFEAPSNFGFNDWSASVIKDSPNYYAPWGGRWAVWGGGSFMLTDKATFNVQASYDEMEDFAFVANVAYEVVPNFVITPEIAYIDNFNDDLSDDLDLSSSQVILRENWGFFVRAQANFGG
ncbi:MAG: porin [Pseudomonadota bacterium]|nr:porin [Pseudomonadota bacterium]